MNNSLGHPGTVDSLLGACDSLLYLGNTEFWGLQDTDKLPWPLGKMIHYT